MRPDVLWISGLWHGASIERFVNAYTTVSFGDLSTEMWTNALVLNSQGRVVALMALRKQSDDGASVLWTIPEGIADSLSSHLKNYLKISRIESSIAQNPPQYDPAPYWPWIVSAEQSGEWTAHDLSADCFNLINWNKGCYLGQEIVARVHAKIKDHKKRLAMWHTKLDKTEGSVLYSNCQFTMGVLPRSGWNLEGVSYVWNNTHDNDVISLHRI